MASQSSTQSELRFVQFNVENLFIYLDHYKGEALKGMGEREWQKLSTATVSNKSLSKLFALAETVKDLNPDVLMLNEVGGHESLYNFNRLFLNDEYTEHLIEGNSDRGIDVGFLVHKRVPLRPLLLTHKNMPLQFLYPHELNSPDTTLKSHFFSRDVAEMRFFKPNESKPSLVILLTHLKSKLDPDGIDFEGKLRRGAELKTLIKIYEDVKSETENQVPILVAGDFNGQAHRLSCEPEFEPLLNTTDLREVLMLADCSLEKRVSQIQFPRDGSRRLLQLDYIFVSPHLESQVIKEKTFIYRFKSDLKVELPLPASIDQSNILPSDHYPVVATFKNFLF